MRILFIACSINPMFPENNPMNRTLLLFSAAVLLCALFVFAILCS